MNKKEWVNKRTIWHLLFGAVSMYMLWIVIKITRYIEGGALQEGYVMKINTSLFLVCMAGGIALLLVIREYKRFRGR